MPALSESIAALPPLQRRMAEAWLTRFEENWHDQKLRECMRALPAQSTLRRPLLLAMIERDLAHHWDQGRHAAVESYLKDFPELGASDELPIELIAAEYNVRQKHGAADLSDFAERFPSRIDDLYVLLKPGLFEGNSAPVAPKADNAAEQRRLELLRAPAEADLADSVEERRMKLLRSPSDYDMPSNGTPMPEDTLPRDVLGGTNGAVDLFGGPELTTPVDVSPATTWRDVPTAREPHGSAHGTPRRAGGEPPQVLGRYRIERRLGSSGSGSIYEALDTGLDRRVALSVPSFTGPNAEADRANFHREARAAAGLSHPLLCPVLEVGQVDGIDFLAMPYIEGDSFQELMKQKSTCPVRQSVDLVMKLASALDAAHRRGVVHRDLKPSNILISPGDTPVVVGFGRATRPDQRTANAAFVAPEQTAGAGALVGPRADVYSLGAIFYQLLTGQSPPAPGQKLIFPGDLDTDLQAACRKAMAAKPDDRYTTMRDFAQDLTAAKQKLRPSEQSTRLSLSRSSQRLPASSNSTPNNAVAKMSELRKLSNSAIPAMAPPPRPGTQVRPKPWKYVIIGGVGLLVLVTTIVALSNSGGKHGEENFWPNYVPPSTAPETKKDTDVKPTESAKDLLGIVQSGSPTERDDATSKLKLHRDAETAEELVQFIARSEWSDQSTRAPRDAVMAALLSIDPLRVPDALKNAVGSDDARIRAWTYREILRRIDTDNQSVLLPVLLNGLRDANPDNRRLVAEQTKQLANQSIHDPSIVNALYNRVCDNTWGELNTSPPNSFIHNPRADGGKTAALEALEELAPERVTAALNVAARSSNLDVRKWSDNKKKKRGE